MHQPHARLLMADEVFIEWSNQIALALMQV